MKAVGIVLILGMLAPVYALTAEEPGMRRDAARAENPVQPPGYGHPAPGGPGRRDCPQTG